MNLIQLILIGCLFLVTRIYFKKLHSQLADRILVSATAIGALLMVVFPGVSALVASWFGVGRGVDFLFYLAHAGTALLMTLMYSKIQDQSDQNIALARRIAISEARPSPQEQVLVNDKHSA